jgi:hypothetical protein
VIFSLAQVPTIASVLAHGAFAFQWPGLDLSQVDEAGRVRKINTILTVNYLPVAGTLLFISGILTMIAFRVPRQRLFDCLARRSWRGAGLWPQSS